MTESSLWSTVRRHLGPHGHFVRVENRVGDGTPDVNYRLSRSGEGWIEAKHLPRAPARVGTALVIPHLTLDQVRWLDARSRAGGDAWLLLQAARWYYLFDAKAARAIYEREMLFVDAKPRAAVHGGPAFPTAAVLRCLRGMP